MKFFAKIVTRFYPMTIFAKSSILDVWIDPEYAGFLIFSENTEMKRW